MYFSQSIGQICGGIFYDLIYSNYVSVFLVSVQYIFCRSGLSLGSRGFRSLLICRPIGFNFVFFLCKESSFKINLELCFSPNEKTRRRSLQNEVEWRNEESQNLAYTQNRSIQLPRNQNRRIQLPRIAELKNLYYLNYIIQFPRIA